MNEFINTEISENPEKEKLFTKEELETIVEQRLSRERKNNESLMRIRELFAVLRKKDAFKKLSNAALAQKILELAEPKEVVTDDNNEKPDSVLPEDSPDKNAHIADTQNGEKEAFDHMVEKRKDELLRFLQKYDEQKLESALGDSSFRSFSRGRRGDLLTLYEDYLGFLSELSESPEAKRYRAAQRQLCSTGFSEGASCAADYGSMLSENQRRIAKAAGMSFKQYAQLLSQIPSKKLNQI